MKLFTIISLFIVSLAFAQPTVDGTIAEGEYASSLAHEESGITLNWSVVGDTLYLGLQAENDGWIGFGLLKDKVDKKQGADQYLFVMSDGQVTALDLTQVEPKDEPALDDDQGGTQSILEQAATLEGEAWTIEFSRKLDTGEVTDLAVVPGEPIMVLLAKGKEMDQEEEHRKNSRWELEAFVF